MRYRRRLWMPRLAVFVVLATACGAEGADDGETGSAPATAAAPSDVTTSEAQRDTEPEVAPEAETKAEAEPAPTTSATTEAEPEPAPTAPETAPEAEPEPDVDATPEPESAADPVVEETAPTTTVAPTTTTAPPTTTQAQDCHPAYTPCLSNLPGDALNCGDLTSAQKPVTVNKIGVDPYRLDRDGDGRGCTS